MKINAININNFRNVSRLYVTMHGGYHVIYGPNMSGKTNTLNAIHWAITGKDMEGHNDDRANIPTVPDWTREMSVEIEFDSFKLKRVLDITKDKPSQLIYINNAKADTLRQGQAIIYNKLGLTDIILTQPKGFEIVSFLLNPLYFKTVAPSTLRKFFYKMADIDIDALYAKQKKTVAAAIDKYKIDDVDPYILLDSVAKSKKDFKKVLDSIKVIKPLLTNPVELDEIEKKTTSDLAIVESDETLIGLYAQNVSGLVEKFYSKQMDIHICLREEGATEGVVKDVCYPILPESGLPFDRGSYAERTFVGVRFIATFLQLFNLLPLPILIDNMESLDSHTTKLLNELATKNDIQYIGAFVEGGK